MAGPIVRSNRGWSGPVMLGMMGCHLVFFLVLKWTFYKHRYHGQKGSSGNDSGGDMMDDGVDGVDNQYYDGEGGSDRW